MNNYSWWFTKINNSCKAKSIKALKDNSFTQGKYTYKAENALSKIFKKPVIFTQNGTNALLLSLMAIKLKKDDEVLVPNFGWIATLQPLAVLGIKFKLIDVDKAVPNININNIKKNISKKTKVIIFVHFHGRMNNIDEISKYCKDNKIILIEDACKAIKCKRKKLAGTYGNFGCFSTGMISLLNSGFGGFIVVNDKKFEKTIRMLKDHGSNRSNDTYPYLGLNFKTSDVYSSLIIEQCNEENLKKKIYKINKIYNLYKRINNPKIKLMTYSAGEIPLCIDVYSNSINKFRKFLKKNDIPFCNLHRPFHKSGFLKKKYSDKHFYNSINYFKNYLMLPCGPDQSLKLINKTVKLINDKF